MADNWIDVTAHPAGGFIRAISEAGAVRFERDGQPVLRTVVPTDWLRYLRVAVSSSGEVAAIGQGGNGNAYLVIPALTRDQQGAAFNLGPSFGQDAVAINHNGAGFVSYVQVAADAYTRNGNRLPMPWSSQGFRDIQNNQPVFGEASVRAAVFDGRTFWRYTVKNGYVVGQVEDGIGVLHTASHTFSHAAYRKVAEGVHFAVSDSGTLAVCALTDTGPFYAEYFVMPPHEPLPAPVPQPGPSPVPPPSIPGQPLTNQLATVERIRLAYPTPLGARHPAFLIEVAKATSAHLLRKDSGSHITLPDGVNVSQDILMFGDQGVDILQDGEGEAIPSWGEKGTISGETVDPARYATPGPGPVPTPTPDPEPGPAPDPGGQDGLSMLLLEILETLHQVTADITKLRMMTYIATNRYFGTITLKPSV